MISMNYDPNLYHYDVKVIIPQAASLMATTELCVPVTRPRAHKVKSRSHSARNTRFTTPFDVPVRMQKVQYSPSELLLLLLTNLI